MATTWSHEVPHPDESHFLHHHEDGSIHRGSWAFGWVFCSDCSDQFFLDIPLNELPVLDTNSNNDVTTYIDTTTLLPQAA